MKDTTLIKNVNSIFKREVLDTAVCKCGKTFDSIIKASSPNSERVINLSMCDDCYHKVQEEEYLKEHNQKMLEEFLKTFNRESLINDKLKQASFGSYQPTNEELTKAKVLCERYSSIFEYDKPRNLLLIGNYGTGKSHLAVSTAKEIMHQKIVPAFVFSTPSLLTKLRSTYNRNSYESEEKIINQLSRVSLLVLDDIGAEQSKPSEQNEQSWATSKIFEIIDNRIGKHTIYTTNYDLKELQQRLGGRNFSRMMENTHVVKMYGEDYRLKDYK
jgi:DNA replication protein DnaC